ncbi:hypothetical protein AALK14_01000 [Butyricimonas hominis]|uniref:hypothetical protein n=1 Tax=Butyricimonas TaxID=574697 RepID=UPI003516AC19
MKQTILLVVTLLLSSVLFAQKYQPGIVKAKNVTYEIKEDKKLGIWTYRNINNPDTTTKEIPKRNAMFTSKFSVSIQIARIVHDHLLPEELALLAQTFDSFSVCLRVDRDKYKLLQVVHFSFRNRYAFYQNLSPKHRRIAEETLELPDKYEGVWLNLPLERLHEIEKDIVDKVKLPEDLKETYLVDDFEIWLSTDNICNATEENQNREETEEKCLKRTVEEGKK